MKLIIAGSRYGINGYNKELQTDFNVGLYTYIDDILKNHKDKITEIVSGTAWGVDKAGEYWARKNGIAVKQFPADWGRLGMVAGHVRNKDMAKYGNSLLAIWDGASTGTESMIKFATEFNLPIFKLQLSLNEII